MNYELMLALKSEEVVAAIKEVVEKAKIKVTAEDPWGKRRLAYRIGQNTEAYYTVWILSGGPKMVAELSKKFKLNKEILRFLFTRAAS